MRISVFIISVVIWLLWVGTIPAHAQTTPNRGPFLNAQKKAEHAKGRFIVKFKTGSVPTARELNRRFKARGSKRLFAEKQQAKSRHESDASDVLLVETDTNENIESLVKSHITDSDIDYIQPDYIMETNFVPTEPYYTLPAYLWSIKKIKPEHAWDLTKGAGIVVAVVDTGLDYNHSDIAANVWSNPREVLDGIDNDGNGYVDDIRGWNFASNNNDIIDDHGHGTHVSGIIAAPANGIGVVGVAPEAKIMALKGLDANGSGFTSNLASAIRYAAINGAKVINNSWGCGFCPYNPAAEDAVRFAHNLGAVVVFAAGNSAREVASVSPQNMINPKPIVVSATEENDQVASFSNFGYLTDVGAPGAWMILSLKAKTCHPYMCPAGFIVDGNYLYQRGTSMAAPAVAGLAALVRALHPEFSPDDVRMIIRASADDILSAGIDGISGAGRINAERALSYTSVPRLQITSPAATLSLSDTTVEVRGTASGPGFREYQIYRGAGKNPQTWEALTSAITNPVDNGLLTNMQIDKNTPAGFYVLRLVVRTISGASFETTVTICIEPGSSNLRLMLANEWIDLDDMTPALSGNRMVMGTAIGHPGITDIYVQDRSTNTGRYLATSKRGVVRPMQPSISGDKIVWAEFELSQQQSQIFLYDLATDSGRYLTKGAALRRHPKISGNKVLWDDSRNGNYDIYMYDLTTNTETRLTSNANQQVYPSFEGNRIVYYDNRNSGTLWDVYMYDMNLGVERRISTSSFEGGFTTDNSFVTWGRVGISGNLIVWGKIVYTQSGIPEFFITVHDLTTSQERTLIGDFPSISGNRIVYEKFDGMTFNITVLDLTTNIETQLSGNVFSSMVPAIDGGKVTWLTGERDVSVVRFKNLTPPTLTLSQATVTPTGSIQVSWSNIDPTYRLDWIGLVPNGQAWTGTPMNLWKYTSNSTALPPSNYFAPSNGTVTMTLPENAPAGQYQFVYYRNNGLTEVARSTPFTVVLPEVTLSHTTANVGDTLTISWRNMSPQYRLDWVGLVTEGGDWMSAPPHRWAYVATGSTAIPAAGQLPPVNGSITFIVPPVTTTGRYQIAFYKDNSLTVRARSAALTINLPTYDIEYLIVAGGGGGAGTDGWTGASGGGGGGGGLLTGTRTLTKGISTSITVGTGGAAGNYYQSGSNGQNSTAFGMVAVGGGGGSHSNTFSAGFAGGSGGGTGSNNTIYGGGLGVAGQGNNGGWGLYGGGGGGGAGTAAPYPGYGWGSGGLGRVNNWMNGYNYYYSSGGGTAGNRNTPFGGLAGDNGPGSTGPWYGAGGGGAHCDYGSPDQCNHFAFSGGSGANGIVMIRYPGPQRGTGGNIISYGGYTVHIFTSNGAYTP